MQNNPFTLRNALFIDIDDCIEHECVNGHCKDGIKSYTCDCKGTGFEGRQCENGNVDKFQSYNMSMFIWYIMFH